MTEQQEKTEVVEEKAPTESLAKQMISYAPSDVADREDYINLVIKDLMNGAQSMGHKPTKAEIVYFFQTCNNSGLNPVTKQIYAIYRKNKGVPTLTVQTSIDGMRATAEKSGKYAGSDDAIHEYDEAGKLKKSSIVVYKLNPITGERMPVTASAMFNSYAVSSNHFWGKMPEVMLAKCAEALALRKAFPNIGQIYTTEEMMQADAVVTEKADPKDVQAEVEKAKLAMKAEGGSNE